MAYLEDSEIGPVLGRDVAWESFASARLISDKDVQLIRRYDKRSPELRASMLDEVGGQCVLGGPGGQSLALHAIALPATNHLDGKSCNWTMGLVGSSQFHGLKLALPYLNLLRLGLHMWRPCWLC